MVYRIILYGICLSARMACNDSVIVPMGSLERKKNEEKRNAKSNFLDLV